MSSDFVHLQTNTSPGVIISAPPVVNNTSNSASNNSPSHSSQGLCRVCSANATGVHYGVLSCEGCKAFFKRAVIQYNHSKCYFGGVCLITPETRGRCKACRLQKCLTEGMALDGTRIGRGRSSRNVRVPAGQSSPASVPTSSCTVTVPYNPTGKTWPPQSQDQSIIRPLFSIPSQLQSNLSSESDQSRSTSHLIISAPFRGNSRALVGSLDDNDESSRESGEKSPTLGTLGAVLDQALDKELQVYNKNSASGRQQTRFSFMSSYLSLLAERNRRLEDTVSGVTKAVAHVYRGQIEDWTFFMEKSLAERRIAVVNPNGKPTPERMMFKLRDSIMHDTALLADFCRALPGFSELSNHEQGRRISAKFSVNWLLNHAPYCRDGEMFSLLGNDHYGRYWMETLLDPRFVRYLFSFMDEVNALNLTLTENYLLLAVIVLQPSAELSTKESMPYVKFLYSHYLDALTHIFSTRCPGNFGQLRDILNHALSMDAMHARYVAFLDFSRLPIRPCNGLEWSPQLGDVVEETATDS